MPQRHAIAERLLAYLDIVLLRGFLEPLHRALVALLHTTTLVEHYAVLALRRLEVVWWVCDLLHQLCRLGGVHRAANAQSEQECADTAGRMAP